MAEDRNAAFLTLAGSKLRSRLSSSLNESASAGVTSKFARRQLEKLGWKEGEGLGKNRDGISTHIRVHKRADEQGGLGKSTVDENLKIGNEWWKDSVGDTLARLSAGKKKKGKKDDKSKKRKKRFTDEELFEATGGSRFGMRAQAPQKGKWKRTETIAAEEEQKAKESVEWDGMTAPQVILSEPKKKKRKVEVEEETEEEKKKRKEEKKKRKEAKKKKSEKKSKKETQD
jgi:Pin2-interacting protein X1